MLARFPFFLLPPFIFFAFSCLYISIGLRAPLVSSLFAPWFPLVHHGHPCRLPAFFRRDYTSVILFFSTIYVSFPLVTASLHMHVTHPTYSNPCAPIQIQPCIFPVFLQNMMFGEISPAIGPKLCTVQPFLCLLALFLCPPVAPGSHRTHTHPYAPIYTCLHPFTP